MPCKPCGFGTRKLRGSQNILKNGARWLKENMDKPYPPLWIGKCLYSPHLVIRSAVLSALALTD